MNRLLGMILLPAAHRMNKNIRLKSGTHRMEFNENAQTIILTT